MAALNQHYPDYLNPFGSDDDEALDNQAKSQTANTKPDDYPEYLSPFEDDTNAALESSTAIDDYDDSLNPFGDEDNLDGVGIKEITPENSNEDIRGTSDPPCDGNPFDVEETTEQRDDIGANSLDNTASSLSKYHTPQPESLEPPPVPLPRTKSLLKKEKAQKNKQTQDPKLAVSADSNNTTISMLSTTSSTSSSSITTTTGLTATTNVTTGATDSFHRKKNKRNAPPVPINFKRQVSGSLDAIEEELNNIGDDLAQIEKEYSLFQDDLKATHQVDEVKFAKSHLEFSNLIRRKNSIMRRQKELMYQKRELKLDQIHSDIEYELRMIGNKQCKCPENCNSFLMRVYAKTWLTSYFQFLYTTVSHKTAEDEAREKELLTKLVEIVEEKSDIVENLNKDTSW